jgi:hypothetical protein
MRVLTLAVLLLAVLLAPTPVQAQRTAYAPDGRPEFCVLFDIASDREASEYIVGLALDDLGYSPTRGAGRTLLSYSQRLMGWLAYLYSQDLVHWEGYTPAGQDITTAVRNLIREYNGEVPGLVRSSAASFNRAAIGCRSPFRY